MNLILSASGYIVTSIGYAFLLLLLLTTRKNSQQKTLLLIASLLAFIWSVTCAIHATYNSSMLPSLASESLRNLSWFLLISVTLANFNHFSEILKLSTLTKVLSSLFVISFVLEASYFVFDTIKFSHLFATHLAQTVVVLWVIEQLFRRTELVNRWTIKPICLGLGIAFAYDFALYADIVLTNTVDSPFWNARGWVNIIPVPLILLTARRVKPWASRVYISRDVVYHSTLLTAAGCYLVTMAVAGYYIKYVGGSWGSMIQNVFFALSGLLLAVLFLSESLRRKLKVFITKHFYANKYEYREEWVRFANVLEEAEKSPYQTALNAMIRPFACEHGVIVSVEGGKLKKLADYNHDTTLVNDVELLSDLVVTSIKHKWIIDLEELKKSKPDVPFEFNAETVSNACLINHIVPIPGQDGTHCACLLSTPNSTHAMNWEDRDLMWAISKQLSVYLHLHRSNKTLSENQQFDTFNRMSAFLAHDLKNILAQLQLLSKNAKKHGDNPEFIEDAFITIDSAVSRLDKVVTQLRKKSVEDKPKDSVSINSSLKSACTSLSNKKPSPTLTNLSDIDFTLKTDKERFDNVLSHLIQNAQEATDNNGRVEVSTEHDNSHFMINVHDDGVGMSENFIENRLFKPFDTTKGNSGMGIGAYDAKKLVNQLGGHIEVYSTPGQGTLFKIIFPMVS
ncbi:PEP-CTERM system histidine kinase PrsK [Vibrio hannami]|uniref:XrtA/PEP-CTERM system histidine kinase PrsK n=1 Tax=Vibrio hannami TaxID=2717094 RepID=UPI002410B31C|nr:XrtA/PEP-CTERM system histidine kinase PrsK [Vibrio hannami]MDG3088298.1 PEP-CTERM system histidine kinase PrsK [Vibrio hannami]